MTSDAKLAQILTYHLKELKGSSWEGDYGDIARQHKALFRDILEDGQYKLPAKSSLGKCLLAVFPSAEQMLRDKSRDCILNVLRDIKQQLKSSTSGKKPEPHLKVLLASYRSHHQQKIFTTFDNNPPSEAGTAVLDAAESKEEEILRQFGLGTSSAQSEIELPIQEPHPSIVISNQY